MPKFASIQLEPTISDVGWKNYVSAFCREQRAHSSTLHKMHLRNFTIQRQILPLISKPIIDVNPFIRRHDLELLAFILPAQHIAFPSKLELWVIYYIIFFSLTWCTLLHISHTSLTRFRITFVSSGGGNAGTSPPPRPRNWKICCRNLVLSSRGLYFWSGVRNPRNMCKFSIEILIKKSQNYLENFQNSLHFWSNRPKVCRHVAYSKSFIRSRWSCFFYKFQSIFSRFQEFSCHFQLFYSI